MNGQPPPPPPPTPPPPLPLPVPQPPPQQYIPPRQGSGCCAKGCLTILLIGLFLMAAVVGTAWYVFHKVSTELISSEPSEIKIEPPTESQYQAAENARVQLQAAAASNTETTIAFTGADLNALLVRDPDLSFLRNRARIEIANSIMTIELSAPLDALHWPGLRGRWFNGTVRFTFAYAYGTFRVDLESAEAGGHEFPRSFISSFNSAFSRSMNQGFQDALDKNNDGAEFWKHIKSMSLEGDKLIVTTQRE